ncbi:hypothetical protein CN918_26355 [Priestia megaterium]|nr:hypothetical protein CN918_26355 [Priestia megaterium]
MSISPGFYSYFDYSQVRQDVYVVASTPATLSCISSSLAAWLYSLSLETIIEHLPHQLYARYLPHFALSEKPFTSYLPTYLQDWPFLREDEPYLFFIHGFLTRFESWFPSLSLEERFRMLVPDYKERLPLPILRRCVQYLYNRHVTPLNRYRLSLHSGIAPYLITSKQGK